MGTKLGMTNKSELIESTSNQLMSTCNKSKSEHPEVSISRRLENHCTNSLAKIETLMQDCSEQVLSNGKITLRGGTSLLKKTKYKNRNS